MITGITGTLPPWSEADRLAALRSYGILDTDREDTFDGIAKAAALACNTPFALINFIDANRLWAKAKIGLDLKEVPLTASICAKAIYRPDLSVVPDLSQNEHFKSSPFVTGNPFLRFYASARLETAKGLPLGTLCVFDVVPRPEGLTKAQTEILHSLAEAVMSHLELRRVSSQVAERERRFRTIVDAIPQKIWTARPDGSHEYFNRRWYAFTGVPLAESGGDGWLTVVHPDDRDPLQTRWQHSLNTGEDYEAEFRLRHTSGNYHWMLARAHPVRNRRGKVERWFGTCTDIHQAKKTEQDLADREKRYRGLIEASSIVVWYADPTGMIIQSNGWSELTGQSQTDYVGRGWLDRVHPDDHSHVMSAWNAALTSQKTFETEYRVLNASGQYRWILASAVPIHSTDGSLQEWVGSISDIDNRKQAEAELQTSEQRLCLALDTTSLGIWDVDLRSGTREWSPETRAILGIARDAPLGYESFLECVHPDDRIAIETTFFSTSATAPINYGGSYRITRADTGEERWITATGRTFLDPDGQPVRKVGTIQDITARKQSEISLRASEERLRLALKAARMVAWEQDLTTNFIARSQNAPELLGIGSGPLSEMLHHIHPDDKALREHFRPGGGVKGSDMIEFRYQAPNGQTRWFAARGEWFGSNRLLGVTFDITDRKKAEAEIWQVANHDALTGLPNRALFQKKLEQALDSAERDGTSLSVLLIDFDHFKEINDILGHDAGDAFLKETASRLQSHLRDCDTVGRLSGDEFAVLLASPFPLEHVSGIAETLLVQLGEPFLYQGRTVACQASIGIATFPDHTPNANHATLLKDADIALFEAKDRGRGRVVTYNSALRAAFERRISLSDEVLYGLRKGQFIPYYQPKVCLSSGRITGLEALARWQHPEKGVLTPGYFGAAYDDPRMAQMLSEHLLTRVAADLRCWLDAGLDPGRVAFNLSSCEFGQLNLPERVCNVLDQFEIPPHHFEVEVTETVLLSRNRESITTTLGYFRDRGIAIALDDFGTGFASLTHLKQFPVGHIKIDRSFVQNLEHDESDRAIVTSVTSLGKRLGMQVTAEGVETKGQADCLRHMGCDQAQGHLFARPVEAVEVPNLLSPNWNHVLSP